MPSHPEQTTDIKAPIVLQSRIPFDLSDRGLPGIRALSDTSWFEQDDAFAGQMTYRDRLVARRPEAVLACHPSAREAACELLDLVLSELAANPNSGYEINPSDILRPDGVRVALDRSHPMKTLGRIVQEDICILQKIGDEHVLTAAALCFPAGWRLDEKFMRPLTEIHIPVDEYTPDIAKRVQRLFDGVQVGKPIWRFNKLWYLDPDLHQPRSGNDRREKPKDTAPAYLRSEKQCILRLPRTRAVVFSIHTYVLGPENAPRRTPE